MKHMLMVMALMAWPIVSGCVANRKSDHVETMTAVATYNDRTDEIWVEEFWYADYDWPSGIHRPGIWKKSFPVYPPFPSKASFRWSDADKREHVQTVEFRPPPDDFTGTIYFRFLPDDSIKVSFVMRKDERAGTDGPRSWRRMSPRPTTEPAK